MSGGRALGNKTKKQRRLPRGDVWRSIDFWSWGLLQHISEYMSAYVTGKELYDTLLEFQDAERDKKLPFDFFIDVKGWSWSVKEDGYFVKLIRDEMTNKWSMRTRRDVLLKPPPSFLKGLEENPALPNVMFGELVTGFSGCAKHDRHDVGKRTLLRNQQFAHLNKIFCGGPQAWVGLRVKVFSFPLAESNTIGQAYELYCRAMARTLEHHPHIGMCRAGKLENTKHAIEIFNNVVQMGLEGIVIVDSNVHYGTLLDRHDDPAQYFFKLKQKIVLPRTPIVQGSSCVQRHKDGGPAPPEYLYTIQNDQNEAIKFVDQQDRATGSRLRLKYMEQAPGMKAFPCMSGYRHMHFATQYDMSVEVPAAVSLTEDKTVRKVLGVDYAMEKLHKDVILDWNIPEQKAILEQSPVAIRLFNPRPFELIASGSYSDAPRLLKRSSGGVFSDEPARKPSRQPSGVWDRDSQNPYLVRPDNGAASSAPADEDQDEDAREDGDEENADEDAREDGDEENADEDAREDGDEDAQESRAVFCVSSDSEENDENWPTPPDNTAEIVRKAWFKMLRAERRKKQEKAKASREA
jgi:hypothetical protein